MPTTRDTFGYHFKLGNKIVYAGITHDLDRREAEHRSEPGWSKGHIEQAGFRTTREAALKWEQEQKRLGMPVRKNSSSDYPQEASWEIIHGLKKSVCTTSNTE